MNRLLGCEAFWMLLPVLTACSGSATADRPTGDVADSCAVVATSPGLSSAALPAGAYAATGVLPLPAIPDSLRTVEARAAYFVGHYWDAMDFADTSLSLDTAFIEQNFSNFIALLPAAPREDADRAVGELLGRSAVEPRAFDLLVTTAANYLDHPNSPMRDEETYILFLRHLLGGDATSPQAVPSGVSQAMTPTARLTEAARLRLAHRLDEALKNRPGTKAADFRFIPRQIGDGSIVEGGGMATGPETNLRKALRGAEQTLVVFYDPDCEHCREIMAMIAAAPVRRDVQILAIAAETDRASWERTAASLPQGWTVGFATTPIIDRELYSLPASPTLYLMDASGTVILKDPTPEKAIEMIIHFDNS